MNQMSENTKQMLEQYLDGLLSAEEAGNVEALLAADPMVKQEFQVLQLAIEAVRYAGLKEQVNAIHHEMMDQQKIVHSKPATIISLTRYTMRVAAGLLFFVGAFGVYKYMSVTPQSVYQEYYQEYELGRTRGVESTTIENAFRNEKWNDVITIANAQTQTDNKYLFLSGVAFLETGNISEAINRLNTVIVSNSRTGDDYFNDEAEFYLSLAHIRNNNPGQANILLNRIKANKTHLYHQAAVKSSKLDLKVLDWKSDK